MSTYILLSVFLSGIVSLGVELSVSRLIEPFFGTSLLVWSIIIGLILLALSVGYYVGGRLADRHPQPTWFFKILLGAGALVGTIPWLAHRTLLLSINGFESGNFLWIALPLVGSLLIVAVPMVLLGMVSPFAIKILTTDQRHAGAYAGKVFALGTLGSIIGAFLPVMFLIPSIGTRLTFVFFSAALMLCAVVGLLLARRHIPYSASMVAVLGTALGGWLCSGPGALRPDANLIFEKETAYNYIQVLDVPGQRELHLSDGRGIHSIYAPDRELLGAYSDLFLIAPFFAKTPLMEKEVQSVLLVGAAAGTLARQFTDTYGAIPITGVELDPEISKVGRVYFGMTEPNLSTVNMDGRRYLRIAKQKYSVIAVDAYRPPYIPFHLTTREFFQNAKDRLSPGGVVVVNAWRTRTDYRLVSALASTMKSEFGSVFAIDCNFGGIFENTMLVGVQEHVAASEFVANVNRFTNPLLKEVASLYKEFSIFEVSCDDQHAFTPFRNELPPDLPQRCSIPFTDDLAPIENITHGMMINFLKGM